MLKKLPDGFFLYRYQMENKPCTFSKKERLCSIKTISTLFEQKKSFLVHPFSVIWLENDAPNSEFPMQVAFSVSKRKFKRAVKRNKIKRMMREAFRHNKHQIYSYLTENDKKISCMIVYIETKVLPYSVFETKIQKVLHNFQQLLKSAPKA